MTEILRVRPATTRDRIGNWLASVTLAVLLVVVSTMAYWQFWPQSGLTKFELTPVTEQPSPGALFEWTVAFCAPGNLPVVVDRELQLQNHIVMFPLGRVSYTMRQPCESFNRAIVLPLDVPTGTYKLVAFTDIEINPLRSIHQRFESTPFEVR